MSVSDITLVLISRLIFLFISKVFACSFEFISPKSTNYDFIHRIVIYCMVKITRNFNLETIMLIRGLTMLVMASLSLVGNVSVIVATLSSPFLHTPSHVLVAFLCFFHLLSAALSMVPIGISCLTEQWIGGSKSSILAFFRLL